MTSPRGLDKRMKLVHNEIQLILVDLYTCENESFGMRASSNFGLKLFPAIISYFGDRTE